jgi:hypothetical protein
MRRPALLGTLLALLVTGAQCDVYGAAVQAEWTRVAGAGQRRRKNLSAARSLNIALRFASMSEISRSERM